MQEIHTNNSSTPFDDEIDLSDLINALFQGRWIIVLVTTFLSMSGVIYSLSLPNIYKSTALLAPVETSSVSEAMRSYSGIAGLAGISLPSGDDQNNSIKALKKLNSLSFFENNIFPNIFLPDLMAVKSWDPNTNKLLYKENLYNQDSNTWVRDYSHPKKQIPSAQESYTIFQKHFSISEDKKTGFINMAIKHQSPYVAKEWAILLIDEVNSFYRQKDKSESQKRTLYLNEQIAKTNLSEIKQVIAQLLQQDTQKLALIEANQYYVFDFIDPPAAMEIKSAPRRSLICILFALCGLVLGIVLVLIKHYGFRKKV